MPCNSDYMGETLLEYNLKHTAQLYMYLMFTTNREIDPYIAWVAKGLRPLLQDPKITLDKTVTLLCEELKQLSPEDRERVVYNGHNRHARALADWWEKHQEADEGRVKSEQP